MDNNAMGNGRIGQQESSPAPGPSLRFRTDRKKAPPELPAVGARNWLLHRHYTRLEFEKCRQIIEEELKEWGGLTEYPNYVKGLILRREGKVQDSLDCFQKAYSINTRNVRNVKQIAKSLFLLGDHKKAIDVYLEAEKMSEQPDWQIYYHLGECYMKVNRLEEAKAQLIRATEFTKNENPYILLAKIHVMEGQLVEAVAVYTKAIEAEPDNEQLATDLGLLYVGLNDTKRAFQQFGTALARSPNYAKAILPMAYTMQTHGELDVAFSKYKVAAQSMPESWALWNNIGMCLYGKQKFVSAITCLKRAHYLNPLALPACCNLGIVYLATGQPASAAIYLCAAVSAAPDNALPYLLLGLALKRLEDLEGAERALEKAFSLGPQDPYVLINYAIVLEAQHKPDRARELLNVLNDVIALIDEVDSQIAKTAKQLATKLNSDDKSPGGAAATLDEQEEERTLADNEV